MENGGKVYSIDTEGVLYKIADDIEYIFENIYNAEPNQHI